MTHREPIDNREREPLITGESVSAIPEASMSVEDGLISEQQDSKTGQRPDTFYRELAGTIPDLSTHLKGHDTEGLIAGDESIKSAQQVLLDAESKKTDEQSEEELTLQRSVFILRRRFLVDADSLTFLNVYTPSEIVDLTKQLRSFLIKNRPDFEGLEQRILDKASQRLPLLGRETPKDVKGAISRMETDRQGRTGMNWHTLNKHANRGCDKIRSRLAIGAHYSTYDDYVIDVADKTGKPPNLSWIYQFVADDFMFDVIGSRKNYSVQVARENVQDNWHTIQNWLEVNNKLLEQLPPDFKLKKVVKERAGRRITFGVDQTRFEAVTAGFQIREVIKDIGIRIEGSDPHGHPRHNPMDLDVRGVLNHQLSLGHMIERLKAQLSEYGTEGYTEEIIPLE